MKQQVTMFSSRGHDVLLEYDPATADMQEINVTVARLTHDVGGRAFSLATGEAISEITPETRDVTIIQPIAGG